VDAWVSTPSGIVTKTNLPTLDPFEGNMVQTASGLHLPKWVSAEVAFAEYATNLQMQAGKSPTKLIGADTVTSMSKKLILPAKAVDWPGLSYTFKYVQQSLAQTVLNQEVPVYRNPIADLCAAIPAVLEFSTHCPAQGEDECASSMRDDLYNLIQHLNDRHRWTRQAIADWLETLDVDLTFQPAAVGD